MRLATALVLALLLTLNSSPAWSWMAYTHVYLAEQALDSVKSGQVTFYAVDPESGALGPAIGSYRVDPDMVAAIRLHRGAYHAGLLGPDAYPDILTGQYCIHPNFEGQGGIEANDWLERLWRRSRTGAGSLGAQKAFVLGFLQHAAGDMFAHDAINWYTGGEYEFEHHNALKHVNIEAYVQTVTPEVKDDHFYDLSVDEINEFLVDTLITTPLVAGPGGRFSVPGWVEALRTTPLPLPGDVNQRLTHGLYQWPQLATGLAAATMFNRTRTMDWNAADTAVHAYFDVLGAMVTEDELVALYEKLKSVLPPGGKDELAWVRKIRKVGPGVTLEILTHLEQKVPEAFGLTAILQSPAAAFDVIVAAKDNNPDGTPSNYPDHPIHLADFRLQELHMSPSDTVFDFHRFRPAYNTYVACQLSLLGPSELRRLVNDLRRRNGESPLTGAFPPNVMLGFVQSMNGSHQWTHGMILDSASFHTLFMDDPHPAAATVKATAPAAVPSP